MHQFCIYTIYISYSFFHSQVKYRNNIFYEFSLPYLSIYIDYYEYG